MCMVSVLDGGMYTTGAQVHTVGDLVEEPFSGTFEVGEASKVQQLTAVLDTSEGTFHVIIRDEEQNVVYDFTTSKMSTNHTLNLEPGTYELRVEMEDADASSDEKATFQLMVLQL